MLATLRPVRRKFMKSWYSQMVAARSKTSGSLRRSQSALGIIHSAETGPAPSLLIRKAGSLVATTASASRAARTSIQMSAGLSAAPSPSRATTLQQVVSRQIPTISSGRTSASATA
jgi:hypothetical protein